MRAKLAIAIVLTCTSCVWCDESRDLQDSPWRHAFEPMSASEPLHSAVMMIITNDDPFAVQRRDEARARSSEKEDLGVRNHGSIIAPSLWCVEEFEEAYQRLVESRPETLSKVKLQGFAAGIPEELTGGDSQNRIARAVVVVCDHQYRLLGIHIGVPRGDELVQILEDAEEVATLRNLATDSDGSIRVLEELTERSMSRLNRSWMNVLKELSTERLTDIRDSGEDAPDDFDSFRLALIGETLDATYMADVRSRFGPQASSQARMLGQLEHHIETRQAWCETLNVLIAGQDFSASWRNLIELAWHHPPVVATDNADELVEWVRLHRDSELIILAVEPPERAKRFVWPPPPDPVSKRESPWRTAHQMAVNGTFREVSAPELAIVIRELELKPINIQLPSMARYVLIEPSRDRPFVVGEGGSPARFTSRLKREGLRRAGR